MKVIYWLQIFIAPLLLFGLIALFTYSNNKNLAIALLIFGFVLGIFIAEFIRRKYGLGKFFGRLYSNEQDNSDTK